MELILAKIIGMPEKYQRVVIYCGWTILIAAVVISLMVIIGLVNIEIFSFRGTSGLRTIAGIAVSGCMLAALGYMNEEQQLND